MRRPLLALLYIAPAACAEPHESVTLPFVADPGPAGSEAYLCFGFDAAQLGGADLGGIALVTGGGPVTLHHVALYASAAPFADGPVECSTMPPETTSLHVWATGGGPLALPADTELVVPDGTVRLIVQAHALRNEDGPATRSDLEITLRRGASHRAGWLPLRVPTPALPPHQETSSSAACEIADVLHVISTWPHMHLWGAAFHGAIDTTPLIDVVPWDYSVQQAYDVTATVAPGQQITSTCVWDNPSEQTILPGPRLDEEMCEQALIAWPVEAAHCQ